MKIITAIICSIKNKPYLCHILIIEPAATDKRHKIMNAKYEVVNIEIQGKSKIIYFADTDIFSSYFGWLRFLATIKEFGYKVNAA